MNKISLSLALLAVSLTGCYTQLATRGHYARGQVYPLNVEQSAALASNDSLASDSLTSDSAFAATPDDSLVPPPDAPTVIVNNYYDPYLSHRGYAHWQWDFPLISFGYYSSHYDRYSRPYWWNEPWYINQHRYYNPHRYPRNHHRYHGSGPTRPSTPAPSGPYKSEKRLFNPEPSYPTIQKGQRGQRAPEPTTAPLESTPAPKESAPESSEVRSQQQGGSSSEKTEQRSQERTQKGRRR